MKLESKKEKYIIYNPVSCVYPESTAKVLYCKLLTRFFTCRKPMFSTNSSI